MQTNPLLDFTDLPRFDQVQPQHVAPALEQLLAAADRALETVTQPDFPSRWTEIAKVLDTATEELGRAWGVVSHLNSVADTPELRTAYNEALPKVTDFWTRLGSDERLYAKYKAIDPASLNAEQLQAHKNAIRNFVLGGAELQGAARERFAAIQERQAELSQKFSENALDATDAFADYAGADELDGVPQDVVQSARAAAQAEGKEGYKLTLKMPSYLPVMQFARSRTLRERVYRAYVTRGQRPGRPEVRQQRPDPRNPGLAPGGSPPAGLFQLRGGVDGAQDGRLARNRSSPSCATSPQGLVRMRKRTSPTCARLPPNASASRIRRPGIGRTSARNSRKSATPSASRRSSSTSPRRRCWPGCSRSSRPCSK